MHVLYALGGRRWAARCGDGQLCALLVPHAQGRCRVGAVAVAQLAAPAALAAQRGLCVARGVLTEEEAQRAAAAGGLPAAWLAGAAGRDLNNAPPQALGAAPGQNENVVVEEEEEVNLDDL